MLFTKVVLYADVTENTLTIILERAVRYDNLIALPTKAHYTKADMMFASE